MWSRPTATQTNEIKVVKIGQKICCTEYDSCKSFQKNKCIYIYIVRKWKRSVPWSFPPSCRADAFKTKARGSDPMTPTVAVYWSILSLLLTFHRHLLCCTDVVPRRCFGLLLCIMLHVINHITCIFTWPSFCVLIFGQLY